MTNLLSLLSDESLGNIRGIGPLGDPQEPASLLEKLLSSIIGLMVVGAILWFVIQTIIAGHGFMTAGGDPKAFAEARSRLVNASIGLVVSFVALVLVSVIGNLLGVDVLNVGKFLENLKIQ